MDIIAARFADPAHARAAARDMRVRLGLSADAIEIRPLGTTDYEAPVFDVVLAGRFPDDRVEPAMKIVESHRGVIVDRRSESEVYPTLRRAAADLGPETPLSTSPDARAASVRRGRHRASEHGIGRRSRGPLRHQRRIGLRRDEASHPSRNGSSR